MFSKWLTWASLSSFQLMFSLLIASDGSLKWLRRPRMCIFLCIWYFLLYKLGSVRLFSKTLWCFLSWHFMLFFSLGEPWSSLLCRFAVLVFSSVSFRYGFPWFCWNPFFWIYQFLLAPCISLCFCKQVFGRVFCKIYWSYWWR